MRSWIDMELPADVDSLPRSQPSLNSHPEKPGRGEDWAPAVEVEADPPAPAVGGRIETGR